EGEIQHQPADFPVTELWEVVAGRRPGRSARDQITLFDSVGFAIEDFSALRYLRDTVDGSDFFDEIDLVAAPDDPKDLFGLVMSPLPVG
ncbi:MAG TPA: ornithine cyclodeaminase, partial [Intrasporangium sp.]|nr:ornithine cyclodeaminase [Intrasporangium sp.]